MTPMPSSYPGAGLTSRHDSKSVLHGTSQQTDAAGGLECFAREVAAVNSVITFGVTVLIGF
ncbi:hypothetical protein [Corynebacterium cystitidis]|uniref:hypothetical protein n=1 Tax=Corynebacterium cystitidis TaxID=35757 RepID=UPI00211EA6D7|nr:hypothetical protein [Corynebacterium cystitidis]